MHLAAGRFTVQAAAADLRLARTVLDSAQANDSFPGLPRPRDAVALAIAPDRRRFREWSGMGRQSVITVDVQKDMSLKALFDVSR